MAHLHVLVYTSAENSDHRIWFGGYNEFNRLWKKMVFKKNDQTVGWPVNRPMLHSTPIKINQLNGARLLTGLNWPGNQLQFTG